MCCTLSDGHTFNGLFFRTIQVSQYQKGKTNLDFTEARDSEWQWHQLDHMQVCTSLQTDNHASNPPLSFLQAGCPSCRPTNSVKALKGLVLVHFQHIQNLRTTAVDYWSIWTSALKHVLYAEAQPRAETQAARRLRHCFGTVNQLLVNLVPFVRDALLEFVNTGNLACINPVLHDHPDLLTNQIQILAIWLPQIWRNKVACLSP